MRIKVLSFNIRSIDDEGDNTIQQRAPRLAIVTSRYNPDIIGFQEFTPPWEEYIDKYYLDEYAFFNNIFTNENMKSITLFIIKEILMVTVFSEIKLCKLFLD